MNTLYYGDNLKISRPLIAHWDGTAETEEATKTETKATIRCIPLLGIAESGKCVYSGKESAKRVVFARAY